MKVEDLESFLVVAHSTTLSEAADVLGISQPTLTRKIKRVEEYFAVELFERTAAGLVLNQRGKEIVPHVQSVVANLGNAHEGIARLMDPDRGTIRLDFMHSLATWMVPDILRDYGSRFPQVDFVLHQGPAVELIKRVQHDDSDLALVGPKPQGWPNLGWAELATQRLAIALPAHHDKAIEGPIDIAEVADENWVGMLPGYGTRLLIDDLTSRAGFTPNFVFESMELTTVAGLVSAGLGVALLPLDDPYLSLGGICLRPINPPAYRELGMVWRLDAELTPPIQKFRDFVDSTRGWHPA